MTIEVFWQQIAGDNNDVGRVHNVSRKRVLRAKNAVELWNRRVDDGRE